VFLHATVSVLSLAIFNLILGGASHRAALLASVLFAVHPIHAEAVSIIFTVMKWWILIIKPTRCTNFSNLFLE